MKHYLNVVEVAIQHHSKFLIIKRPDRDGTHAGGLLSFPGGKVDEIDELSGMDILRHAAKREIFEELGLELKDRLDYVVSNYFVDNKNTHIIDTIFHCKVNETILDIVPSQREVADYYWMSVNEIQSAHHSPEWLKKYIGFILEQDVMEKILI